MRLLTERADHETQVIRVVGDLEWQDASLLSDVPAQTDPPPRRRVIDLSDMTFIDSMGMKALLELEDATSAAGGETVLVLAEDSYVRRLLEIRGVLDRFRVAATRAEALSRLS
jgi:anti-anti-sigma factor